MSRCRSTGFILSTIAVLASGLFAGSSSATETVCSFSGPPDQRVTMNIEFVPDIRMFVTPGGNFKWEDTETNGVDDCGDATVKNTNSVLIRDFSDPNGNTDIALDFRNRWAPGLALEKNDTKSEIEIDIQDDDDGFETLRLLGSDRRDNYVAGEFGFNLNNDGDRDLEISMGDIEELYIKGRDRGDNISLRGGSETGEEFLAPSVTLQGDSGLDVLEGASGDESFRGGNGDDDMFGSLGADRLFSDDGADLLVGGRGGDELDGMRGRDRLRGARGADDLEGGPGDDDLEGGPGVDTCAGGTGVDSVNGCES